jgi:hypothetical protein
VSTERDFTQQYSHPELVHLPPCKETAAISPESLKDHWKGYLPWEIQYWAREQQLGKISNRFARNTVRAAYAEAMRRRLEPSWIYGADYLKNTVGDNPNDREYRAWVRQQLRHSELAQLIPGGRSALPNIYEPMSERWRAIEQLLEPRSYPQLIGHVAKYLDWYLEPTPDVPPPGLQVFIMLPLVGTLLLLFMWPFFMFQPYLLLLFLLLFAPLLLLLGRKKGKRRVHNFYSACSLINSAELFYYLLEEYADPPEDLSGL